MTRRKGRRAPEARREGDSRSALQGEGGLFRWNGPIIDVHAHPGGLGEMVDIGREFVRDLVASFRLLGVVRMSALGEVLFKESGYTAAEIRRLNDRNAVLAGYAPDFFIPFCFLDPVIGPEFVRDEVSRCYEEHGFRAIKLEVCCNVADPATDPVFEAAARRGFPVMVHTVDTSVIGNRRHQSDPEDLRQKALRHPDATIVMAHLTGAGMRGVREIEDLPNVAVDTSGMQAEAGIVEYAVEVLGADRILFGSDVLGRDLAAQIGQVLGAEIPKSDQRRIFHDNALRWLGGAL